MSMYNAIFGVNRWSPVLRQILKLDVPDGYDTGRFRDISVQKAEGEPSKIVLFTRNGGGNREEYQYVFDALESHPNYLCNYDDDYDCTYASVEFSVPEAFQPLIDFILSTDGCQSLPMERFKNLIDNLEKTEAKNNPDVQKALAVGKEIFGELEAKMKDGVGGIIEV